MNRETIATPVGVANRVAVVIAAKDAAETIERAVRSALAQPETAEVVVVDDGSVDGTAEVVAACDDGTGRLRVIRQANRGPSAARNVAIDATVSPFLSVLDADDYFTDGRFRSIFETAGTDWELVCDKLLVAKEGAELGPYLRWRAGDPLPRQLGLEHFVDGDISRPTRPRQELGYLKPLIRRRFLDAHGLRFREDIWLGEDYLLYTEILIRGGRFKTVENYGYVAVQRPHSLSHRHPPERLEALLRADEVMARTPGVSEAARMALERHHESLRRRWILHRALEAKRQGRWVETLWILLGSPSLMVRTLCHAMRSRFTRA